MLVGMLVCVYVWSFLIGNSWIKPAVLKIMEYRPTWHGIYVDISRNLDSSKPIFFAGGKNLPLPYYVVLLTAIKNDLPPSKVLARFVYPSRHDVGGFSEDVHAMSTEALREALKSLHDRHQFGSYVLLAHRKDTPGKELLRRIARDVCVEGACVVRRKKAASYLIFHSEKLRGFHRCLGAHLDKLQMIRVFLQAFRGCLPGPEGIVSFQQLLCFARVT